MKKIELTRAYVDGNAIRYEVCEEHGLGILQQEKVELFIRYHFNETFECDLNRTPFSILALPISLYLIPITYFYNIELVIPEMDKELYDRLPQIYAAYAKIYGPFEERWRGKVTVRKVVKNSSVGIPRYDKVVFFSGGVDACHAGINNPGKRSLLVSIPDIESMAVDKGPLRNEKFSLIKNFASVVGSDWLLISNDFNAKLYRNNEISRFLAEDRGLSSPAYNFDGWGGIKYVPNMCCVAPIAFATGVKSLLMGSANEEIDGRYAENLDGVNPLITNSVAFADIVFDEQDALLVRRSKKVKNIIEWCRARGKRLKLWACFSNRSTQCGFCGKCVRTQLNILCAGENPSEWGFDGFSEKAFSKYIRLYCYLEKNPCWLWDNIETIEDERIYPCLDGLLHWLKKIGYKEYCRRVMVRANPSALRKILSINRYPHYVMVIVKKLTGRYRVGI